MMISRTIWRHRLAILSAGALSVAGLIIAGGVLLTARNNLFFFAALLALALSCFALIVQLADHVFKNFPVGSGDIKNDRDAIRAYVAALRNNIAVTRASRPASSDAKSAANIQSKTTGQNKNYPQQAEPSSVKSADTQDDVDAAKLLLQTAIKHVSNTRPAARSKPTVFNADPFERPNDAPAISVVIPMYNEARFIAAAIDSLKKQTFGDFEAIIVDDASTDESMAVAMKAVGGDQHFRLVRHASNSGLSAARNTGLRLAQAPLITFLDSDDMFFPDALEVRFNKFRALMESGEAGFNGVYAGVYCRLITMPQSITLDEALRRLKRRDVAGDVVTFVNSNGECPFNAHAPMLITEIVRRHGGFDETLRHGCEDWDLWQRILRNGYAFAPTRRLSGVYRRKRGSMVKETPVEHLRAARTLFDRARAPIDPSYISANAPNVFERELHFYSDQLRFTRRAAQFATINAFASEKAFSGSIDDMPSAGAAFTNFDSDVRPFIEAGIRRSIAIDEPAIEALGVEFEKLTSLILAHIQTRLAGSENKSEVADHDYDALFFPQTQAQVAAMATSARSLIASGRKVLFVHTETETGDQGQRAFLEHEGLESTSYNRAQLLDVKAGAFVVMRPYSAVIRDTVPIDAALIEISNPDNAPSMPDENIPRKPDVVCQPGNATGVIEKALGGVGLSRLNDSNSSSQSNFSPAPIIIAREESFHQTPDFDDISKLKDKWRGERCVIIGNGPSINQTDLGKLKNEFTFAVNGIFYKSEDMGFDPTFYVVEDSSVMKENVDAIRNYQASHKLFPTIYRQLHPKEPNVSFFLMNRGFYEKESPSFCIPRFSVDAARRVYCGQSVTHINLQLAYYFGFQTVYLIGVDFSYVIPESAIRDGDIITSTEDDPNHFHGDYFGKGKTWKDPKLHRVMLNYELARDMFAADGRKVVNATKGGALEVFERVNYDDIFR